MSNVVPTLLFHHCFCRVLIGKSNVTSPLLLSNWLHVDDKQGKINREWVFGAPLRHFPPSFGSLLTFEIVKKELETSALTDGLLIFQYLFFSSKFFAPKLDFQQ